MNKAILRDQELQQKCWCSAPHSTSPRSPEHPPVLSRMAPLLVSRTPVGTPMAVGTMAPPHASGIGDAL